MVSSKGVDGLFGSRNVALVQHSIPEFGGTFEVRPQLSLFESIAAQLSVKRRQVVEAVCGISLGDRPSLNLELPPRQANNCGLARHRAYDDCQTRMVISSCEFVGKNEKPFGVGAKLCSEETGKAEGPFERDEVSPSHRHTLARSARFAFGFDHDVSAA